MERKCLSKLVEWKNNRLKPLMIYGPRQVGKTYLIKELFAEKYYKNKYIYVDCKKDVNFSDFINGVGENASPIVDAVKIVEWLSIHLQRKIDENTLLIFDEVQEALPLVTALKYFKQDCPKIPVIVSGSMVRIKIKRTQKYANRYGREDFFYPVGAVQIINLYPVTFEEFLMNHNIFLYRKIVECYKNKTPLDISIHGMALEELYKYLLVGGMPENVQRFLNGDSFLSIRQNIVSIATNYLNDMELYQASNESIIRTKIIFNSIFSQLNKESKNFRPSLVGKDLRYRDLMSPIDWLITSGIVYKSDQVKEKVTLPLMSIDDSNYRLYVLDTGILSYQSGIDMTSFIDSSVKNELFGILFENYVACELKANEIDLFFWKGKRESEFEFLLEDNHTIIPVDAKKGRKSLVSLEKFKEHNKFNYALKVSSNNYGYDEERKILTIPLYMLFAYINDIESKKKQFNLLGVYR